MTIALVDDSDSDIELLHDYLSRYCHDHHVYMTIEKFTDEHIFLNSMQHKTYDLVFLDIYMGHMDGIQLACEISREDPKCQIIFITTSEEHAVAAAKSETATAIPVSFVKKLLFIPVSSINKSFYKKFICTLQRLYTQYIFLRLHK